MGQAFNFDGLDDEVNLGNGPTFQMTTAVSVDAWISPDTSNTAQPFETIVSKWQQGPNSWGLFIVSDGPSSPGTASLFGIVNGSGGFIQAGGGTIPVGPPGSAPFTHVAMSYSNVDGLRLYVNGVQVAVAAANGTIAISPAEVHIGDDFDNTLDREFDGRIDEVEIFNRVLTGPEVFGIYNAGTFGKCKPVCTPPPGNMIAWYKAEGNFDDGAPPTFENGSPNATVNFVPGRVNQAFSFTGANRVAVTATSGPLNLTGSEVSLDGWIKPNFRRAHRHLFRQDPERAKRLCPALRCGDSQRSDQDDGRRETGPRFRRLPD